MHVNPCRVRIWLLDLLGIIQDDESFDVLQQHLLVAGDGCFVKGQRRRILIALRQSWQVAVAIRNLVLLEKLSIRSSRDKHQHSEEQLQM